MAVNEDVTSYNTTAASNTPAGTDVIGSDLDDHLRDMKKNMATLLNLIQANVGAVGGVQGLSFTPGASSTIAFTPGGCVDVSGGVVMRFSHMGTDTRILTAGAWAGGSGGNIMETIGGRVANTGYYIWAIHDTTNVTSDFLASTSGSFSGLTLPGTYDKAQLLWFISLDSSGFLRRWNQAKNTNQCTYFSEITATAGAGAGSAKVFQSLSLLNIAPNHALVKVGMYIQDSSPTVGRIAGWLADGSSSWTAQTVINATYLHEGDTADVISRGAFSTWVTTDGISRIKYAYTESLNTTVNIRVYGFQLLRRGNAAGE